MHISFLHARPTQHSRKLFFPERGMDLISLEKGYSPHLCTDYNQAPAL